MYNVCIIYIIYNYNIARKSEPVFPGKGQGKSAFVFGLGFCFFSPYILIKWQRKALLCLEGIMVSKPCGHGSIS